MSKKISISGDSRYSLYLNKLQFLYEYTNINKSNFCLLHNISRPTLNTMIQRHGWQKKPNQLHLVPMEDLKEAFTASELKRYGLIPSVLKANKLLHNIKEAAAKLPVESPPESKIVLKAVEPPAKADTAKSENQDDVEASPEPINLVEKPTVPVLTDNMAARVIFYENLEKIMDRALNSLMQKLTDDRIVEIITTETSRRDSKTNELIKTGDIKTIKKVKKLDANETAKILQSLYPYCVATGILPNYKEATTTNIQINTNSVSKGDIERSNEIKTLIVNNSLDARFQAIMQRALERSKEEENKLQKAV